MKGIPDIRVLMQELRSEHVLAILAVSLFALLFLFLARSALWHVAERMPPRMRMPILRMVPIVRLLIGIAAIAIIIPILVEPTVENVIAMVAAAGLILAFAFKDYGSSLVAGLVTLLENTYQPGDWIEVDGSYGEVKAIGLRAVHIVTADDTEVIIPHSRLWSTSIFNASSGSQGLLCVAHYYLQPDHDGAAVRQSLAEIAESSSYRRSGTPVVVIVLEKPWGTLYRLKAYARESREQFLLISDLTIRGKKALLAMNVRFAQAHYAEVKEG
jgi:small conductance mechanosensitive channel